MNATQKRIAWLEERIATHERLCRELVAPFSDSAIKYHTERASAYTSELSELREQEEIRHNDCHFDPCPECMDRAKQHAEDYRL